MSRKQAAKARQGPGAGKRRQPRQPPVRAAPDPDAGCGGLARQLRALGLKLREVPGDGNCLFRALGDQLEGHSRNHLRHRQETVDYMIKQREDFEPFVEDDVPFDKHVTNLAKPGTFAGNDAIVAFARNNQINVVIHQFNTPLWQVQGTDKTNARELHIAYRYGEHYDSVRRISDDSQGPAYLQMEMFCKNDLNSNKEEEVKPQKGSSENEIEDEDAVHKVCKASGCSDADLVSQILEEEGYNIESAIFAVLQVKELERISTEEQHNPRSKEQNLCSRTLREANGSGSRISGNQSLHQGEKTSKGQAGAGEENRASRNPKVSKKQKKEQQRLEKKKRQEERHRQKAVATKSDCADSGRTERDSDNQVTLVKATAALNI
ncbi:OTU domain-containing protein 3 [Patagioenas fasciata monilis]|uniref:OTU domain-containing protein 3 n=1 Tax=Patagioenas fasciata monilis TaxID=372326 RepID=A0A1V4KP71_PATFA|nr:OTU domain-containing protein 3 [Patagioenas fasciata monilis]